MNFLKSRRQIVLAVAVFVLVVTVVYGFFTSSARAPEQGDASNLVTYQDVDMDESTRFLFDHRIRTFRAALAAQEQYEEISGKRPNLNLYFEVASNANVLGDLALSRDYYEQLLQHNPLNYVGWNNLGNILVQMHDFDGALNSYRQSIEQLPTEEGYRDYIAVLEREETGDRNDEVLAMLEKGVARLGQNPWFMVKLAEWHLKDGNCEQAFAHYDVAIDLEPDREAIQKEYEEAKESCR